MTATHRPRKRFGQNFLKDPQVIFNLLSAIGAKEDQHFVEIGPGKGALTFPLAQQCRRLDVIELDRDLVQWLHKNLAHRANVQIHQADALTFDFSKLNQNGEKLRLVGNLPYNISTPLLFHMLDQQGWIQDMLFMLQKEVVERICALPGSKQYGKLSVMSQYYCQTEKLFDVHPQSFSPPPKVISSVIRLIPHTFPPVRLIDQDAFKRVVTQAFSQRRKMLRNSLRAFFTEQEIQALHIDPNARPETLNLEDFARLSNALTTRSPGMSSDS